MRYCAIHSSDLRRGVSPVQASPWPKPHHTPRRQSTVRVRATENHFIKRVCRVLNQESLLRMTYSVALSPSPRRHGIQIYEVLQVQSGRLAVKLSRGMLSHVLLDPSRLRIPISGFDRRQKGHPRIEGLMPRCEIRTSLLCIRRWIGGRGHDHARSCSYLHSIDE